MTDFLIVGRGLAATVLMHRFDQCGISFITVDNKELSSSSRVAAGIWNPVVFKRLTKSWMADRLIPELNTFYRQCEASLQKKLVMQRDILKPFGEEQEALLWRKKATNDLEDFLSLNPQGVHLPELANCQPAKGYGIVKQAGNLDVSSFLDASEFFFRDKIISETFDHRQLRIGVSAIQYKELHSKNIIFCEGFLVKNNPFFNWVPMKPVKGELLDIEVKGLSLDAGILNRGAFLMRYEGNNYKLGATYNWEDLTELPSATARQELEEKLRQMITVNWQILAQHCGIRPSSADRRPIIGAHPAHGNLYIFNGLGAKGVMLAPYFSENFVNFYLKKEELHSEVNVKRFYHVYEGLQKK